MLRSTEMMYVEGYDSYTGTYHSDFYVCLISTSHGDGRLYGMWKALLNYMTPNICCTEDVVRSAKRSQATYRMVAYGVPVIHQSLATAPLDIKEAIDWLIRIGGKDVKDTGNDKTGELLKVAKRCFQQDIMPGVPGGVESMDSMEQVLRSLVEELAKFVGYDTSGTGFKALGGLGIGRRSSLTILSDIARGDFLLCCKNERTCISDCKCCSSANVGSSHCSPQSCPVKALLISPVTLTGMCADDGNRPPNGTSNDCKLCCILSFWIRCFQHNEQLSNNSFQCQHCDGSTLHENCHRNCKCKHTSAISKVSCRINCLIQLATTVNTLYINKKVPMCLTCQHCKVCNPDGKRPQCEPCHNCIKALTGNGEHCKFCRTGQCCGAPKERKENCNAKCENCQNCSVVRNAKAFWDMLNHVSYSCGKCTECSSTSSPKERKECPTCSVCQGESCDEGCQYRKLFGRLIYEFIHFMANNFADMASTLRGNISRIKDQCCEQLDKTRGCQCTKKCCGPSTGTSACSDCEIYCICCVDQQDKGSCVCANQCSEKLELLLRPALSGYVSAYDYKSATWENLCKSDNNKKCSDQCNSECKCDTSVCPEEGCCTYCPKRQCAKILCMVIPAIYNFFNYVKHQVTMELSYHSRVITSQWADAIISGDAYLGELFRSCGFSSDRLQPRMGCGMLQGGNEMGNASCQSRDHIPGNIEDILDSCGKVNKDIVEALRLCNIHSDVATPYRKPDTVRDKLLWLSGLPYSDVYDDLQKAFGASLAKVGDAVLSMRLTLNMTTFTFHCFEDSSHGVWEYVTQGFQVPSRNYFLYYNHDPVRLLWDVYDALYDVTCALTFMCKQCSVSSINSGWEQCNFGRDLSLYEGNRNGRCQCKKVTCKEDCPHCTRICNACRPGAKCACCCPHCEQRPDSCVCMIRFISSTAAQNDALTASPFCNATYGHMGFRKERLRKSKMTGAALFYSIAGLLTKDHAIYSRLLECLSTARAGVPDNLSDYYALFLGLGMRLELGSHDEGGRHKALANGLKSSMTNAFLGACDTTMDQVVGALRKLYNQDHSSANSTVLHKDTSSNHYASDLASLYGCYSGVGCVGYMYALSSGPYELFSRYAYNGTEEFASLSTNWVLCGASTFYNLMKNITAEVHMLECCKGDSCTCNSIISNTCECTDCNCFCQDLSSGCYCGTIIKCKYVHPLLYRNGFTFHEPDMWSYPKRRCKDFSDTLHRFIGPDSMLCQLIEAIEQFLWHVRMPFCLALLVLWATAFCFLIYVFIGHMDRLGIRTRWLLPKQLAHPLQLVTRTMLKSSPGGNVML